MSSSLCDPILKILDHIIKNSIIRSKNSKHVYLSWNSLWALLALTARKSTVMPQKLDAKFKDLRRPHYATLLSDVGIFYLPSLDGT
mmetsp:Transcript_3920/g.12383  ORF Transcript_3920/g.12383 Transcript_3920/m.12383 type:complete len:86 (+) Transcript_3920:1655-1912(+)